MIDYDVLERIKKKREDIARRLLLEKKNLLQTKEQELASAEQQLQEAIQHYEDQRHQSFEQARQGVSMKDLANLRLAVVHLADQCEKRRVDCRRAQEERQSALNAVDEARAQHRRATGDVEKTLKLHKKFKVQMARQQEIKEETQLDDRAASGAPKVEWLMH